MRFPAKPRASAAKPSAKRPSSSPGRGQPQARRACAGDRIHRRRSRQPPHAHRHRQRRHAVPGGFGRQCRRAAPADDPSPASPGRLRRPATARASCRSVEPICGDKNRRESMMYVELDRADARGRQELAADLKRVLTTSGSRSATGSRFSARCAKMPRRSTTRGRGAAQLVRRRGMTLLGYHVEKPYEAPSSALGIFSIPGAPTDEGGALGAMRYFEKGGDVPLMAKAERKSTVHRRVPLDLVVVPIEGRRDGHRDRRPCRPVDQRSAARPARERAGAARAARSSSTRISGSIRRAIRARRCAMRSPRCRATWSSPSITKRCASW